MINPISSVAPLNPAEQALQALASQATQGAGHGVAPVPSAVTPEMQQNFQSLMQRNTDHAAASVSHPGNVIQHVIERQQGDLQRVEGQVENFLAAAPGMGASEVVAASMAVSRNVAVTNLKLQIATSITQGSNKSLQTLLKNQ
jgi:type III secretion system HrpB2-like protein